MSPGTTLSAAPSRSGRGLIVVLIAVLIGACAEEALPPELPPRAIQWKRIGAEDERGYRVISGIVTAVSDTKLAFEVRGTVATVSANLGQQVKQGDELARLDPEPLELAVRDAVATLASAKAQFQDATVTFERASTLFEQDVASEAERDRAKARYDSTKSGVEAAEARRALAERDLRRSVLRAPFDGSISVKDVEPAQNVFSGKVVFEMDSGESGLRAEVQVPETLIAKIFQGQAVEVSFPSISDALHDARISEVGTRAAGGNAFTVKADLVERVSEARPGMTAEVRFSYAKSGEGIVEFEGFMVPIAAIRQSMDGKMSVYVFDSEASTVSERAVVSGGVRDNTMAILEGLAEGDVIATAGVSFLRDGQSVTLLE